MTSCPLVSIITPMFNAEDFIEETVKSVQSQSYGNWEMLVVDNCSTDSSRQIVNRYANSDNRIKLLVNGHNSGSPGQPRNIGIKNAKGKYISFLDADDLWMEDKLQKQIEYLEAHNDVFMLYGRYKILKNGTILNNKIKPDSRKMKAGRIFRDLFLSDNFVPCLTVMFRNRYAENYLFDENPRSMEDFDLWLKISRSENVAFLDEPLGVYRVHGRNTTSSIKVTLSKYLVLLKKWQKDVPVTTILARYLLLLFQIGEMTLRRIKDKTSALVVRDV